MSRFLFAVVDGGGNVPAQLAIARRLAARGHDVHVLGDCTLQTAVERIDCRFHPFVRAPQHNMRDRSADLVRDWEPASPMAQLRRIGDTLMFGPSAAYARDVLDAIERAQPHAVAVDCLSMGVIIGAEKAGLPAALLVHYPIHPPAEGVTPFGLGLRQARGPLGRLRDRVLLAVQRRMVRFGLTPVNAARTGLGLPPLREVMDQLHALARSLVLTCREFDFVPSDLSPKVRYVGPQLDDPEWPEPWTPSTPDDDATPLVVVSLGSTYQRQEKLFAALVRALGTLPVRALATYGPIDPPSLQVPDNVAILASAPHAAVFPRASAIVCHGGHGTVMKALAHGLPVVVTPLGRDQHDNGARLEATGAGLSVSAHASVNRLARTIRRVLEEPRFREHARRMAAIIARDVKEDRAVAEMEALAASAHGRADIAACAPGSR